MTSILRSPVQGRPVWTGAGMAARLRREYQDQRELLRTLGPLGNER